MLTSTRDIWKNGYWKDVISIFFKRSGLCADIYSNDYKIVIFIDKYNYMETVVIEQLIAVISLYYNSIILE